LIKEKRAYGGENVDPSSSNSSEEKGVWMGEKENPNSENGTTKKKREKRGCVKRNVVCDE